MADEAKPEVEAPAETPPAPDPYEGLNDVEKTALKQLDEQLGVDPTKAKATPRERLNYALAAEEGVRARTTKTETPAAPPTPVKKEETGESDDPVAKLNAKVDALTEQLKQRDAQMTAKERQALFEKAVEAECKTYDGLTAKSRELVRKAALLDYLTNPSLDPVVAVKANLGSVKEHDTERGKAYIDGKLDDRKKTGESAGGRSPAMKGYKPGSKDLESGAHYRHLQKESGAR